MQLFSIQESRLLCTLEGKLVGSVETIVLTVESIIVKFVTIEL